MSQITPLDFEVEFEGKTTGLEGDFKVNTATAALEKAATSNFSIAEVDANTGFGGDGMAIRKGSPNQAVFNVKIDQGDDLPELEVDIVFNSTGETVYARATWQSFDVDGETISRPTIIFTKENGNSFNLNAAANIGDGEKLWFRVKGDSKIDNAPTS